MKLFTKTWIKKARQIVGNDDASPSGDIAFKALDEIERQRERIEELEKEKQAVWKEWLEKMEKKWDEEDKQERRWIPVSEWEQKENVDMLIRVVVRGLKRTFTGYLKDGEWKIPLDWTNSIPVTSNLVTHVMPLPQPPQEEE